MMIFTVAIIYFPDYTLMLPQYDFITLAKKIYKSSFRFASISLAFPSEIQRNLEENLCL